MEEYPSEITIAAARQLDEYFSEAVFNMPFLQQFSLALAVIIVVVEIILGVMLLLGYLKRTTLWLLLLMIVFFTFFNPSRVERSGNSGTFTVMYKKRPFSVYRYPI